ncbi:MAG: hypothetical protein H6Q68_293 [Firmicutes bacterium]|nr:hypothetical protein [Bacillota bacterium]
MHFTTPNGFYFFGTIKELRHFLTNLCIHYTTVAQLLKQKH